MEESAPGLWNDGRRTSFRDTSLVLEPVGYRLITPKREGEIRDKRSGDEREIREGSRDARSH